ncbi:MAG: RNA methyltransferase [Deltaproteobacteria bacterium]|nr:RNA methyltransferase [Deltaproteobacteria bacterium]
MALAHYPVVNKRGEIIASAVTNLDIHDMARAVRTYGARALYIVTPLEDQQALVKTLVSHWTTGSGSVYNPKRCQALEMVCIQDTLEKACEDIALRGEGYPRIVVTSAKNHPGGISISRFRDLLETGSPCLLVFGTAWGLSQDCMEAADHILEPIRGNTEYNHLSVRSATSIILDRLLGRPSVE